MAGADLAGEVSTVDPYVVPAIGAKRFTVAALDLGIKAMTPHRLAQRGIEVHVLPARSTIDDVLAVQPDGVFFSNGPGDPAASVGPVDLLRDVLARRLPFFGICFGNQLLGRALGFGTYKLGYGHRGINQPVHRSRRPARSRSPRTITGSLSTRRSTATADTVRPRSREPCVLERRRGRGPRMP